MTDLMDVGIAAIFFLLTWGLLRVCDRLSSHDGGGKQ